ncbi:MAG TPA: MMPL family transporter [Gaiellaceae bacterium]|jgi:RND superfamily putative drug exporter
MLRNDPFSPNFAARAGRWSAAHWKTATFGWLAFVAVAFVLGSAVGTHALAQSDAGDGESGRASSTLGHAGFKQRASEIVLIQSHSLTARDSSFRAVIHDVARTIARARYVVDVHSPLDPGNRSQGQVSKDRHSAIVRFEIAGNTTTAKNRVTAALNAVAAAQRLHPHFIVQEAGDASADRALSKTLSSDFKRAERLALPITLLIMLLAFGALVAAGLPVLLAFSGVIAAIGISSLLSHLLPAADTTMSVILLVGMAVGVDYSLFYLKREREERAAGHDPHTALLRTAATSGQAVLISGATVLTAVAGMLLSGDPVFKSIGVGAMIVVACAIVGSLTVLPALMHRLGDRVEKGRIPLLSRLRGANGSDSRLWGAVLDATLKRPALAAGLTTGLLVAATIPAFSLQTKFPSLNDLPHSIPIVQTVERVNASFPGTTVPAVVVIKAPNIRTPRIQRAITALRRRALASGQLTLPIETAVNPAGTVAHVTIPIKSADSRSKTAYAALRTLRGKVIPDTIGAVPGVSIGVTGETAGNEDFNSLIRVRLPIVFAFVLGLAFLLLLVTFRSLVIPTKSIVLNLLSVGAAYGILVLVFQHRWAEGILGFRSNGGIASWIPLFLFVLLFGLSMDYHVFILSRVREHVLGGASTEQAVSLAIRRTAGTVTAAAIVMVAVFSIFATLSQLDLKQAGFGLAVAILIDATLIRGVLLPATMTLLGERNWYLPRWLEWIPQLQMPRSKAVPAGRVAARGAADRLTPLAHEEPW